MSNQLIECVPNISEGRDKQKIKTITDVVETVEGVKLLDVDPGKTTNRTVITFVGTPERVIEAAFLLIKKASELIDMSKHLGEHPRFGATDVCPLIPIANISMSQTIVYAHKLGKRVGEELNIPGYFYENAASTEERKNLANCRAGEYEGLAKKLIAKNWKPDFGPAEYVKAKTTGVTAISARDFLVAYNINLNTTSTRRANAIAFDIRERGRVKREGNKLTGKILNDKNGNPLTIPGTLKEVKGIGWYIEEYGITQLSLNLTNISITPMHIAFNEALHKAQDRGIRVTGSELVGLVPLSALLDAGKYFLRKQKRSLGVSDEELIKIAIKSMGLDELKPFNPRLRVIEYLIEDNVPKLTNMSLSSFANETSSESPAPGGGSIAAYVGVLGISLATMVANLSAQKRGWDHKWEVFSDWAEKGMIYQKKLLELVDEDTHAFNKIMDAFSLPKQTKKETEIREKTIQEATKYATEVPLKIIEVAYNSMEAMKMMAEIGNPNSVTDAGVGVLCARTAVRGALLNVKINASDLEDKVFANKLIAKGETFAEKAHSIEIEIMKIVEDKIS